MVIVIFVLSFLLDGALSNVIPMSSLWVPLFSVVSLVLLCPYLKRQDYDYYIAAVLLGICYDFVYTDTFFLNAIMFFGISFFNRMMMKHWTFDYLRVMLLLILNILFYRVGIYVILIIIGYFNWDSFQLWKGIYSSIFLNMIYGTLIYAVIYFVEHRFHAKNYRPFDK